MSRSARDADGIVKVCQRPPSPCNSFTVVQWQMVLFVVASLFLLNHRQEEAEVEAGRLQLEACKWWAKCPGNCVYACLNLLLHQSRHILYPLTVG